MATAFLDWREYSYQPGVAAQETYLVTTAVGESLDGNGAIATTPVGINSPYSLDGRLLAAPGPSVTKEGNSTYKVVWRYQPAPGGEHSDPGDKLNTKSRVRWLPGSVSREIDQNVYGVPRTNTAGTPLTPTTRAVNMLQFEVYRYYSTYQVGLALQYQNRMNANAFTLAGVGTVQAGQCMCEYIGPTQDIVIGASNPDPIEVVHRFEVRSSFISGEAIDWEFFNAVIDKGRRGWWNDNGTPRQGPITCKTTTDTYEEVSEDVLLDGHGKPLRTDLFIGQGKTPIANPVPIDQNAQGIVIDYASGIRPTTLIWTVEKSVDFSPLINSL